MSDPDLRIPIGVWKKRLSPTALELFLIFYNGDLAQPTTFKLIKEHLINSVSDITVREALKTLIKNKCLVARKVFFEGKRKNLYQLALKYRKRSNRIKYSNARLRERFNKADAKSASNRNIPIRNKKENLRVTSKNRKPPKKETNDSNDLEYSCLTAPKSSMNSLISSSTSVDSKKSLTNFPLRSNSVGITNEHLRKKRSRKSPKKRRSKSLAHVAVTVPKDRLSRIEIAKSKIRSKSRSTKSTLSKEEKAQEEQEFEKAYDMARAYEAKLREYHRAPHLKFIKSFSAKYRGYQSFLKAAKQADALDMPYAQFVEAQFFYFHKWFRKAPSPYEICGGKGKMPAKSRAISYLREELDIRNIQERVTREGRVEKKRLVKSEVLAYNQKLLENMMSDGSTEEECLLEFAQKNMHFFDSVFLKQSKLYRKLKRTGKL